MAETRDIKGIPKATHSVPPKRSASQTACSPTPQLLRVLERSCSPAWGFIAVDVGGGLAGDLQIRDSLTLRVPLVQNEPRMQLSSESRAGCLPPSPVLPRRQGNVACSHVAWGAWLPSSVSLLHLFCRSTGGPSKCQALLKDGAEGMRVAVPL